MEKHLDSMVMVARGASRNVRIVRMYPLTVLFTFTMVIIINCILGLTIQCYNQLLAISYALTFSDLEVLIYTPPPPWPPIN